MIRIPEVSVDSAARASTWVLGYDCAVRDENTGLARALWTPGGPALPGELHIHEAVSGRHRSVEETLLSWLRVPEPVLLAVDAPLGWPEPLGRALAGHRAGEAPGVSAHALFRRETDRVVRRLYGRQTLDVGADRIARTALRALELLEALRRRSGRDLFLPLRTPRQGSGVAIIEAYPAGWLAARGLATPGYRSSRDKRGRLLDRLARIAPGVAPTGAVAPDVVSNGHVFDALLCTLVGADFLAGRCVSPADVGVSEDLVRREGWIWLPAPSAPWHGGVGEVEAGEGAGPD